jgi:hypothetical protein
MEGLKPADVEASINHDVFPVFGCTGYIYAFRIIDVVVCVAFLGFLLCSCSAFLKEQTFVVEVV